MNERPEVTSQGAEASSFGPPELTPEIAAILDSASAPHPTVVLNLLIAVVNGRRREDRVPAAPARYAEGGQTALRRLETDLLSALACPPRDVPPDRVRALLGAVRGFREEVLTWPIGPVRTARPSATGAVALPI